MRAALAVALAICLGLGLFLMSTRAASQPSVQFPPDQPAPLAARVALLEQRAHKLEQRLAAFEKVGLKPDRAGGYTLVVNGASATIDARGRVTVTPAAGDGVTGRLPPASGECDPPFVVDSSGIRRPKPGCNSGAEPNCEPPYFVDQSGIKRFIPECLYDSRHFVPNRRSPASPSPGTM